ncbi:aldolase/citrate lyase family protein [Pseudomonas citronellolis]|uniref:HpcH/HpaI aldolase/citrate lyase family protein n=1 Tax=Pseudomonas citronellolis TaxID=53408 RepID=UPI0026488EDB|nr:aldolase/citrate lyase family protein [Pseudomonas citronellolis]MDN6875422.1 aldolase/citrate lyase family protein [Pseudomonas citronellolis]
MNERFLPDRILFDNGRPPRVLPMVDHYAGSEKFMLKALALQCEKGPVFDLTLDLEDGSTAGREHEQTELVSHVLCDAGNLFGRVGIRIHDATSRFWKMQCAQTIRAGHRPPAYVTLPKVTGVKQVFEVARYISALRENAGIRERVALHVMIEEPGALSCLETIVRLPEVECVSFGLLDFISSFNGALPISLIASPNEFTSPIINDAKVKISTLCHANGKVPSHSLCSELKDPNVISSHAATAFNSLGFRRMWSIHPHQIEPILQASKPPKEEIQRAAMILELAVRQNWAPIRYEDRLHDRASYRYFWAVLKTAYMTGSELPMGVQQLFKRDVSTGGSAHVVRVR